MTGSLQQRRYLALRAADRTMMTAAVEAGIPIAEARLIENAIVRGELALPHPEDQPAAAVAATTGEADMARNAKPKDDEVEELHTPDFKRAVSLYRTDIRPAQAKVGEYAQEQSTAYKEIKKGCHVHPGAAKLAFKLDQMEESKRDDYLRSLYGLMAELKIGISQDLVDQMGDGEAPRMPVAERPPVELVH